MRLALVSTMSAPVRQHAMGSVESLVWLLARELARMGHDLTVFCCGGSEPPGDNVQIVPTLPGPYGTSGAYDDWQLCEWVNLCHAVRESAGFDLIHTHAYLWGIPLEPLARCPMLHTLHIFPDPNTTRLWESSPGSAVTAVSLAQWRSAPHLRPAGVIPHAVDPADFEFTPEPADYLLYLGRFTSGKGPIHAINAARSLKMPLVLAGPENDYFRERIRPLVDDRQVRYAGYAGPAERNRLLGRARALLYPIQYPESFGLVLIEAMLCGTPVAAISSGAVPEILEEGVSGFTAPNAEQFAACIPRCLALDRRVIHQRARERFSPSGMARDYAALYTRLTAKL